MRAAGLRLVTGNFHLLLKRKEINKILLRRVDKNYITNENVGNNRGSECDLRGLLYYNEVSKFDKNCYILLFANSEIFSVPLTNIITQVKIFVSPILPTLVA